MNEPTDKTEFDLLLELSIGDKVRRYKQITKLLEEISFYEPQFVELMEEQSQILKDVGTFMSNYSNSLRKSSE